MLSKRPDFHEYEPRIYKLWEENDCFKPEANPKGKPFSILLPPPNANASLHVGHTMYVIEDLLIRWHRMLGDKTLWLPGSDHAGFETQYVYENILAEKNQSRFDFDRDTLYKKIDGFVRKNSGLIQKQLRRLGFSLDWSRDTFTLDKKVVEQVCMTFRKMHADGLVYRDNYLVNYCPHFGTTFADLEVKYVEKKGKLYYLRYPLIDTKSYQLKAISYITVATTRPETMLGDTAMAVHPDDKRYQKLIGRTVTLPLTDREIPVIADNEVDREFGSGAVKITPAHDTTDFEIGKRHGLEVISVIDFAGKMNKNAGEYQGLSVQEARNKIVANLSRQDLIEKVDENYTHRVSVSYKGEHPIEPMVMPNWYIKTSEKFQPKAGPPLAEKVKSEKLKKDLGVEEASLGEMGLLAVKKKLIKIIPERFEKTYYQWMNNIKPWPISRQIVWGIRIPAWYDIDKNPHLQITFLNEHKEIVSGTIKELLKKHKLEEIESGLQTLIAPVAAEYIIDEKKPGNRFLQETDVFDTWFSSGQWPLVTLGYPNNSDFKDFYPTAVLDTMWDILFFWVARMIMLGLYLTGDVPFETVYLHSMVTDEKGAKMSKSKGNVIDPLDIVDEYGADALRMSLLVGSAPGNPVALSMEKVKGYRNFVTKVWNASRFVLSHKAKLKVKSQNLKVEFPAYAKVPAGRQNSKLTSRPITELPNHLVTKLPNLTPEDQNILTKLNKTIKTINSHLKHFRFSQAGEDIYNFFWHDYCDTYIEQTKERLYGEDQEAAWAAVCVLTKVLIDSLKLLHPFMPFVTEEIYQKFREAGLEGKEYKKELMISSWPKSNISANNTLVWPNP
ncbi:valine--tRNA ligase [Patescibacteria group bacterium]|nr:valine--tRNA ligase [Patescibacteria group bacterium]